MVRSGFWNSLGTDIRTYYNTDFSHLMSLMIKDGIHQNYGEHFVVLPGTGLQVVVQTGECWFNECWVRNDADLQVSIDNAPIVAGSPGSSPVAPTLTDTDDIHWHLLALVTVNANVTSISASNIENKVGTTGTPFITGILETVDITTLLGQWSSQFNDWMGENNTEFQTWFQHMKDQLDEDAAGHLQNEIDDLDERLTPFEAAIQEYTNGIGSTNIKSIGDGTITGAIKQIDTSLSNKLNKSGDELLVMGDLAKAGNPAIHLRSTNREIRDAISSTGDYLLFDYTGGSV